MKSCDSGQGRGPRDAACYNVASLVPRPHPQKGGRGSGDIFGSCKLSILTFAKANQIAAPRLSCDLASGRAATIMRCQLAV